MRQSQTPASLPGPSSHLCGLLTSPIADRVVFCRQARQDKHTECQQNSMTASLAAKQDRVEHKGASGFGPGEGGRPRWPPKWPSEGRWIEGDERLGGWAGQRSDDGDVLRPGQGGALVDVLIPVVVVITLMSDVVRCCYVLLFAASCWHGLGCRSKVRVLGGRRSSVRSCSWDGTHSRWDELWTVECGIRRVQWYAGDSTPDESRN